MTPTNVYDPATTAQPRKLLFETGEPTGNVTTACQKAQVGRTTFYLGKPRFEKDGYVGLETCEQNGVAKGTGRIASEVEAEIWELHDQHAEWGKHRMTHEIAQANNWVPVVSPTTVRRVLEDAGLWKPEESRVRKK